jgi:uncharacterized protein YecE (DUF72 family)
MTYLGGLPAVGSYEDDVFRALERARVALCLHDMEGSATARERVGPFVYVRFHGWQAKYSGNDANAQLDDWAEWLAKERKEGRPVYAHFNNDAHGHAPRNAVTLRTCLEAALTGRTARSSRAARSRRPHVA